MLRQAIIDAIRGRAEAGYRRRHLGRALHRALLPGGRIRPGRRHHAPDRRMRAGRRTARSGAASIAASWRPSCHERAGTGQGTTAWQHRGRHHAPGARTGRRLLQFGATREAFLASLAPLIAFPLVGGVLMLLGGGGLAALSDLLATLCALLAPPVLSFEVARLWGRQDAWLRFATAFNWCQWAIPVAAAAIAAGVRYLDRGWACRSARARRHGGARAGLPTACGCTGSWRDTA